MKLKLKHLVCYLPYGIPAKLSEKGIFNQDDEFPNPRTKELGVIKNISFWDPEITGQLHISDTYSFDFDEIDEIDIVLRPLSDLTKEIEVNGEKFVPYEKIKKMYPIDTFSSTSNTAQWSYRIIEKLAEWHFDFQGLIPSGLAIDINTLKK
jgi:hypothetical protein